MPLPYSELMDQVAGGNVTAASIEGRGDHGSFAHPLTWWGPKARASSSMA